MDLQASSLANFLPGISQGIRSNDNNSTSSSGPRGLVFGDNISSSGLPSVPFMYVQDVDIPLLPKASSSSLSFPLFNSEQPWSGEQSSLDESSLGTVYERSFDNNLQQIAEKNGLSEDQKNQLNFAELTGQAPSDPFLAGLYGEIKQATMEEMVQMFGQDVPSDLLNQVGPNSPIGKLFNQAMQATFESSFESALKKFASANGLSDQQIAQLKFAHFNPDAVTDPQIKQMLQQINQSAVSNMSSAWGMPSGFTPKVSDTVFNLEMGFSYDEAFKNILGEQNLSGLAQQLGMSESSLKGMLTFLHFNSGLANDSPQTMQFLGLGSHQDLEAVLSKLGTLQQGAASQIAPSFGMPGGFIPGAGESNYEASLESNFVSLFQTNLSNQNPPLTDQQIADVNSALSDPSNPNISSQTKVLIQKIRAQTINQVQVQFSLPVGWAPPIGLEAMVVQQPRYMAPVSNALNMASEVTHLIGNFVNTLKEDSTKALMINVLKTVSDAIAHLKENIVEIETQDARMQSVVSHAHTQATLDKLKLQQKKIAEAQKKAKKLKPLMGFLKIFKVIFQVLTAILSLFMGPVGVMISASMFQDIATGGKQNFLTDMFQAIMKNVPSPANILLSIGAFYALTMTGLPNPIIQMQVFFNNSQIIPGIVKAAGGSKEAGEMANMITQMAAEIILMIVMTVVTGGAAAGALMAEIQNMVAQVMIKVLRIVSDVIGRLMGALDKMASIGPKIANQVLKIYAAVEKSIMKWESVIQKLGKLAEVQKQISATEKAIDNLNKVGSNVQKVGQEFKEGLNITEDIGKTASQMEIKITEQTVQKQTVEELKQQLALLNEKANEIQESISAAGGDILTSITRKFEGVNIVLDATQAGVSAAISIIKGIFAKSIANIDAEIEVLENLIKILEQIIQKILSGIQSLASWYSDLGNAQGKMWSGLSQTMTGIAGANQG